MEAAVALLYRCAVRDAGYGTMKNKPGPAGANGFAKYSAPQRVEL